MGQVKTSLRVKGVQLHEKRLVAELEVDAEAYARAGAAESKGGLFARDAIADRILALIPALGRLEVMVGYDTEIGHHVVTSVMTEALSH